MSLDLSKLFEDIEESILGSIPRNIEAMLAAPRLTEVVGRDRRVLALLKILGARVVPPYILVHGSRSTVELMTSLWERGFETSIARVEGFDPRSVKPLVEDAMEFYRRGLLMLFESRIRSYEIARRALRAAATICLARGDECDPSVARALGVDRIRELLWF